MGGKREIKRAPGRQGDGKAADFARTKRRGLLARLAAIPHLFAKCIIIHCIICGTLFSYYALRILSRTGQDGTALLGVVLAFFGGELLILCLRTVLAEKNTKAADAAKTEKKPTEAEGDEPGKGDAE